MPPLSIFAPRSFVARGVSAQRKPLRGCPRTCVSLPRLPRGGGPPPDGGIPSSRSNLVYSSRYRLPLILRTAFLRHAGVPRCGELLPPSDEGGVTAQRVTEGEIIIVRDRGETGFRGRVSILLIVLELRIIINIKPESEHLPLHNVLPSGPLPTPDPSSGVMFVEVYFE